MGNASLGSSEKVEQAMLNKSDPLPIIHWDDLPVPTKKSRLDRKLERLGIKLKFWQPPQFRLKDGRSCNVFVTWVLSQRVEREEQCNASDTS